MYFCCAWEGVIPYETREGGGRRREGGRKREEKHNVIMHTLYPALKFMSLKVIRCTVFPQ